MVQIPAGPFWYPLPGDANARQVHLSGYRIDATEVTVERFAAFCTATGRGMPEQPEDSGPDHPVVNVTWDEAAAYCRWRGGELPTEAQWLKAALGGGPAGEAPWLDGSGARCANVNETDGRDRFEELAPVASFPPNGFGLYDVVGNATEWVRDGFAARYPATMPERDPPGPEPPCAYRTLRGFGWYHCTNRIDWRGRDYAPPDKRHPGVGFRCSADPAAH